jgi:hypothetical protein
MFPPGWSKQQGVPITLIDETLILRGDTDAKRLKALE